MSSNILRSIFPAKIETSLALTRHLDGAIERMRIVSWIIAGSFVIYGFSSLSFIRSFDPDASLSKNLWPRIFFNSLPMILLGELLYKSKVSRSKKLTIWMIGFGVIFCLTSLVFIWPLSLSGFGQIMLYVNGGNCSLFVALLVALSPPPKLLPRLIMIFLMLVVLPLSVVTILTKQPLITIAVLGDTSFAVIGGTLLTYLIGKKLLKFAELEISLEQRASEFLGPIVTKAIYSGRTDLLAKQVRRGFIVVMDIRESTRLQKEFGQQWPDFIAAYSTVIANICATRRGYVQKTTGDGHLISFGVMEDREGFLDLLDSDKVEGKIVTGKDRRLIYFMSHLLKSLQDIVDAVGLLSMQYLSGHVIKLGVGIDKGDVVTQVQGHASSHLELDITGEPINCASRLEAYSKQFSIKDHDDDQIGVLTAVFSPFAADYVPLDELSIKSPTTELPIRDFEHLKWVIVRRFSAKRTEIPSV